MNNQLAKVSPPPVVIEVMVRTIVTTCGKKLERLIAPKDEMDQHFMRIAMVGCGTDDAEGNYVEIADVVFSSPPKGSPNVSYPSPARAPFIHWKCR